MFGLRCSDPCDPHALCGRAMKMNYKRTASLHFITLNWKHTHTQLCEVNLNWDQVSKDHGCYFSAIKHIIATLLLTVSVSVCFYENLIDGFNKSPRLSERSTQKYQQRFSFHSHLHIYKSSNMHFNVRKAVIKFEKPFKYCKSQQRSLREASKAQYQKQRY